MALPRFVHDFAKDFAQFLRPDLDPFAFVRFHDGEYHVLEQLDYRSAAGWETDGGPTWICIPLRESLRYTDPGYYYGISSPCDSSAAAAYYRDELGACSVPQERMTFSSIFAHINYKQWGHVETRFKDAIVVGPTPKCDIQVPLDGINHTWDVEAVVQRMREVEGRPIFVSAGPCANVLIHRYWSTQPPDKRVIVIDVGAAIDTKIHGKPTRPYHAERTIHRCDWNAWTSWHPISEERRDRARRKYKRAQLSRQKMRSWQGGQPQSSVIPAAMVRDTPRPGSVNPHVRDLPRGLVRDVEKRTRKK